MKLSAVVVVAVLAAAGWGLQGVNVAVTSTGNDKRLPPHNTVPEYHHHFICCICAPPEACSRLPELPHKAITLPCTHHNPVEAKCPSELRLCCKMFKESHLEIGIKTPATSPRESSLAGNEGAFSNPEYTGGNLQNVLEQVVDPSVDTRFQDEDLQGDTGRIPSSQSQQNVDKNKTKNIIVQSNISEKEHQSPTPHSDLHKKDTSVTQEVLHHEAALQLTYHGAAMTKQQHLPAVTYHDAHEVLESHKKTTNERENSEQPFIMTERGNSEQEPSSFSSVDYAYQEMEGPSYSKHSGEISPHPLMVDNENIHLKGSHSHEHTWRVPKNSVRNSPETVIYHKHCLVTATPEQHLKNYDKSYNNAVSSLNKNGFLVKSNSAQNGPYKIKVSSVISKLSECKQDNTCFDEPTSSKYYTFHPQTRRHRNVRHYSVLPDEQSTPVHDGQINEITLNWRTYATKYHPIELSADRQISPIYSSVLLEKGVMFSVFFWVYLIAFLYVACYIVSSFAPPVSIFGVIIKVLLVHYFPSIIQLEVFRAIDYIMAFIFEKFT